MALAELHFIDRAEASHLIGPPGAGKSHDTAVEFSLSRGEGLPWRSPIPCPFWRPRRLPA
jgi:hypothetical protein